VRLEPSPVPEDASRALPPHGDAGCETTRRFRARDRSQSDFCDSGHASLAEVQKYIVAVEQDQLAEAAMVKLAARSKRAQTDDKRLRKV
jgi:hypothetical protein